MNFNKNISIERTVGWLDSFYPVILKYQGENNKEIIANTEKILSDVPNKGYDYPILKGIETNNIPLIHFSYTNEFNLVGGGKMFNPKHNSDLANFTAPENNFMCDITIYGYTINNETFFKIDYNCERFTKEFMEKFGYAFLKNINSIMSFTREDYSGDAYIFSDLPDKKKLFFIHSANFGSEYFYYMAQKLKDEYSFIVLEPYNRNHKENQLSSIEEFAEKYIEIMKSIQPEGPYYIGGYCYGGIIAHEMAVQLKKQNEKVDKLILFESYYIDDDNTCKPHQLEHCNHYNKENDQCDSCEKYYYVKDGKCEKIPIANCKYLDYSDPTKCVRCDDAYELSEDKSECITFCKSTQVLCDYCMDNYVTFDNFRTCTKIDQDLKTEGLF